MARHKDIGLLPVGYPFQELYGYKTREREILDYRVSAILGFSVLWNQEDDYDHQGLCEAIQQALELALQDTDFDLDLANLDIQAPTSNRLYMREHKGEQ